MGGGGHLSVAKLLVERRADFNVKNEMGYTALHFHAFIGNVSLVNLLVERGADVRLTNSNGQTASDVERFDGKLDVSEWLKTVGRG